MSVNAHPAAVEKPQAIHISAEARRLRVFLSCVLIISFCLEFVFWTAFMLSPLRNRTDFRQLYVAGYMARTGHLHQLYDLGPQHSLQNSLISPEHDVLPFNHPSFEALWFAPLSLLPYKFAYFAWLVANLLLLAFSLRLLGPWVQPTMETKWLAPTMVLLFLPVQIALLQGQDSVLLLLLLTIALVLLSRNRDSAAGAITALGMFKFQIVLPIAFLFLLVRRWRFAAAFSGVCVMLGVLSVCLIGTGETKLYLHSLSEMSLDSGQAGSLGYAVVPQDMATLRGLVSAVGTSHFSARTMQVSAVIFSVLLLPAVAVFVPKKTASEKLLLVFVLAAALAGYHVLTHDMSIVILPILLILGDPSRAASSPWLKYSAAALFSAPLSSFFQPHHLYLVSLVLIEFLAMVIWLVRDRGSRISENMQ
jgi:hypothetical protein